MTRPSPPWFPAKRYGWGWGLPARWQGWVVLAVYTAAVVLGAVVFDPARQAAAFAAWVGAASGLLVGVCWWTGEPPRWRWGGEDR